MRSDCSEVIGGTELPGWCAGGIIGGGFERAPTRSKVELGSGRLFGNRSRVLCLLDVVRSGSELAPPAAGAPRCSLPPTRMVLGDSSKWAWGRATVGGRGHWGGHGRQRHGPGRRAATWSWPKPWGRPGPHRRVELVPSVGGVEKKGHMNKKEKY
jgi:hypothetical protein